MTVPLSDAARTNTTVADWVDRHAELSSFERTELLRQRLGVGHAALLTERDRALHDRETAQLDRDAARLAAGEPLAYVLGEWDFRDFTLEITPAVLVPRPETETLVEAALDRLHPDQRVLDLGTGSGAIAIAMARAGAGTVLAVDRSAAALKLARINAARNAARNAVTIEFRLSDWFARVPERFHMIVSNPPYVAAEDPHLPALRHEPRQALVAGPDGLDALRRIIAEAPRHLLPGGWLLVEHGYDQSHTVTTLFEAAGFTDISGLCDLGGRRRVALGRTPAERSHG
jgi:release factor glutamine methyltransferase